jgi:ABC-type Fe3+/spermidine/putrescine transport system ATPase subunit
LIIKDGELLQTGKPADIYQHPKHIYTAQILGNAVVLTREDAEKIGLKTEQQFVVFYPEWAEINNSWNSRRFEVKDVYYKGFYDELLVERKGVNIRALQLNRGEHKKNDHVQLNINHFLEF